MLRLPKPETRENVKENLEKETENETRSFYTPTEEVRINSTQNNDTNISRNMVTGVLTDSANHPKRPKIRSQSQPASKERPVVARTLFGSDRNDNPALLMPKALTATLPTFDGKTKNLNFSRIFSARTSKCTRISRNFKKLITFTPCYETPYKRSAI